MDHLAATFEVKAVDHGQRLIDGYAAVFGNLDRAGDVLDVKAFDRTLRERQPTDVAVFVGHQHADLPVGEALELYPDAKGLFTRTHVLEGPLGDQLLSAARKGLLGMSIGYFAREHKPERLNGKTVRRLLDVDLVEYSFAAKATIANPEALIVSVKQGLETKPWHVVKRGGEYCVVKKNPDGSSGRSFGCHATEADAMDQMRALYANEGKTDLPDSAFAHVPAERGGARLFPHHTAAGDLDADLLSLAIEDARDSEHAAKVLPHLLRHAAGEGDADDAVWRDGAAPALLVLADRLRRLAEDAAEEQKALARLGYDTKSGRRLRPELRRSLQDLVGVLGALRASAEHADRDEEGKAAADRVRRDIALMEVALWPI